MVSVPVLHAENLLAYNEANFCKFWEKNSFYVDNIDQPVPIVFRGDKGGTSTKFHFSIMTPGITTSAYNKKLFAMYEAADTCDNIRKVLDPFFGTIKNMQQSQFCLKGHKVKVLLNGDFKNLGLLLGRPWHDSGGGEGGDSMRPSDPPCKSRKRGLVWAMKSPP